MVKDIWAEAGRRIGILQEEQDPLDIKIQLAQDELFRAQKKVRTRGNKANYDRLRAAKARLKTLESEKRVRT